MVMQKRRGGRELWCKGRLREEIAFRKVFLGPWWCSGALGAGSPEAAHDKVRVILGFACPVPFCPMLSEAEDKEDVCRRNANANTRNRSQA